MKKSNTNFPIISKRIKYKFLKWRNDTSQCIIIAQGWNFVKRRGWRWMGPLDRDGYLKITTVHVSPWKCKSIIVPSLGWVRWKSCGGKNETVKKLIPVGRRSERNEPFVWQLLMGTAFMDRWMHHRGHAFQRNGRDQLWIFPGDCVWSTNTSSPQKLHQTVMDVPSTNDDWWLDAQTEINPAAVFPWKLTLYDPISLLLRK